MPTHSPARAAALVLAAGLGTAAALAPSGAEAQATSDEVVALCAADPAGCTGYLDAFVAGAGLGPEALRFELALLAPQLAALAAGAPPVARQGLAAALARAAEAFPPGDPVALALADLVSDVLAGTVDTAGLGSFPVYASNS